MQILTVFVVIIFAVTSLNATDIFSVRNGWFSSSLRDWPREPFGFGKPSRFGSFSFNDKWDKSSEEREREQDKDDIDTPFDPTVVVVDTPKKPSPSSFGWNKGIFTNVFTDVFPKFSSVSPWWKGPNVCVERKEIEQGPLKNHSYSFNIMHTSCKETNTDYTCTKRIQNNEENKSYIEKRQCCYGYKRKGNKCEQINLEALIPTMKKLEATRFVDLLSSINFVDKLNEGNFTIYCPSNDALIDFEEEQEDNRIPESRVVRSTKMDNVVQGHITEGYLRSGDFVSNQVLLSANGKTGIRMNIYIGLMGQTVTANCAKIIGLNNYATNGVVHIIDRMFEMPTKTVMDMIDSNPKFTILKELLYKAKLDEMLRDPNGNLTLFAPTDEAFRKNEKLLNELHEGKGCVLSILRNLLVLNVICTSAIPSIANAENLLGKQLMIKRDNNDKLYVNDAQITVSDNLGINGVIHVIEELLIPDDATPITKALDKAGMTDLLDLIELAGMQPEFSTMKNFTFFAPKHVAVKNLMEEKTEKFKNDPRIARELLETHIIPLRMKTRDFHNNQILYTLAPEKSLRINKYEMIPGISHKITVQCVPIISYDNDVCEATIHVVDKPISLSNKKLLETLEEMQNFTTFVSLIKKSGLDRRLEENGPYTVLAPTNEAFDKLKNRDTLENRESLQRLIKLHILPEMLCCSAIRNNRGIFLRQYVTTLDYTEFPVHRSSHGVRFSSARATECDHVAKNGVIHVVNKVIQIQKPSFFDVSDVIRDVFSF